MPFSSRDERVSQRVSGSRALMDTNLVAPVTRRDFKAHFDFFKLVGFKLWAIVPKTPAYSTRGLINEK